MNHPPQTTPDASRAFSLLELLVSVAIITVLAALVMPAISKLRAAAEASKCIHSLQTLGTAFRLYTADNDQKLPPPLIVGTNVNSNWRRALLPYVGLTVDDIDRSPFICPPIARILQRNKGRPGVPNFGMNRYLSTPGSSGGEGLRLTQIDKPTTIILATEATLGADLEKTVPFEGVDPSILMRPGNVHSGANHLLMVAGNIVVWRDAARLTVSPYTIGGEEDMWRPEIWK
jgi:prepilin-type N-terminal cleavage/methylation domain-containing protein